MHVPDADTKAHRLALLAGLKATQLQLDSAIVKGAETFAELLQASREVRTDIKKLEESLRSDE